MIAGLTPGIASADVRITIAQDVGLGSWTGSGGVNGNSNVCIYNSANANYVVKATATGGAFNLVDGGNSAEFEVFFKDSSGTGGTYTQLPYNTTRSFSNADTSAETCGGGYNANLRVTVSEAELGQAPAGSYSSTITITVTPN